MTDLPADLMPMLLALRAAGFPLPFGLGSPDGTLENLHTFDGEGGTLPLSTEERAFVDAWTPPPPPLEFSEPAPISGLVRTVNLVAGEVYRQPLEALTGYAFSLMLLGVDAGNGAVRRIDAEITVKRLAGAPSQVGATAVLVSHADTGTATWAIVPSFDGNDAVISVTGSNGRTVDWALEGTVVRFTPAGF